MTKAVDHPARISRRLISILTAAAVLLAVTGLATVGAPPAFSAVPSTGGRPGGDQVVPGGDPVDPVDPAVPADPAVPVDPAVPADPAVPVDADEGYYVRVLLDRQVVLVYLDGQEVRSMVCSAGTAAKPTPTGRFFIQNRGEFFFSEKYQQGGRWWVSFRDWGIYLFHSVPTNRNGEIIPEEAAKLGRPASHGCVRLSMDDARWLYDTIPEKTPVDITG
jgi:lipoprotein-anchoring transpeptidase ErfK/SrfK